LLNYEYMSIGTSLYWKTVAIFPYNYVSCESLQILNYVPN